MLFPGEIKGTDKLIPVFDACGVRFGWVGNQAILYSEIKETKKGSAFLS